MRDELRTVPNPWPRLLRLDCGFSAEVQSRQPPRQHRVLMLGRTDIHVKGIDLFARAAGYVSGLMAKREGSRNPVCEFVLRGADKKAEQLEYELKRLASEYSPNTHIVVRPYSADAVTVAGDWALNPGHRALDCCPCGFRVQRPTPR